MKQEKKVNKELRILWEIRDLAKDDEARKTAQAKIDEYFLGKPEKKEPKKKKKKQYILQEEEWDMY